MIIKYGSGTDEGKRYREELKYWSNACGELHRFGEESISEKDLPPALQIMYEESWSELPYGIWCYLARFKGEDGISLQAEYHEFTDEGKPGEVNNLVQANNVAELLSKKFDYPVTIAEHQGFPGMSPVEGDDDQATEVALFIKTGASKEQVDEAAKYFGEIAYL